VQRSTRRYATDVDRVGVGAHRALLPDGRDSRTYLARVFELEARRKGAAAGSISYAACANRSNRAAR
jgi:hypothetical protein